jgi:hypothetical protein
MAALLTQARPSRKYLVVNINNRLQNASQIYPEMSIWKFRGIWLDQVFDDAELTGDETRVMRAITTYMRKGNGGTPDNRTPRPGNESLSGAAHVSPITVRRALANAKLRGHLHIKEDGRRSPRILIPILKGYDPETGHKVHTESAQNEQSQSFDNPSESDQNEHTESAQQHIESAHESAHLSDHFSTVKPVFSPIKSNRSEPLSYGVL